jgi:hypothetical protein
MSGRVDIFIEWGLQLIQCFLDEAPPYFLQLSEGADDGKEPDFLPDGRLGRRQVYLGARSLASEVVVHQLNALVDQVLLILASWILPPEWAHTADAMSRSRKQLLRALEERYGVNVADLPGWSQVERLREDANSLKHRGGESLPETGPGGLISTQRADIGAETLQKGVEEVRRWLLALWNTTEGAKSTASSNHWLQRPAPRRRPLSPPLG